MRKISIWKCIQVILSIVTIICGAQVLKTEAGMKNNLTYTDSVNEKQKLKVYADFKDKIYDGTTDAELVRIRIAEDMLLGQDKDKAEEITESIVAEGRFYKACAEQEAKLSVAVQVSASFKTNSKWNKKYELVPVNSEAMIRRAKLRVRNVQIKDKVYDREKIVLIDWDSFEIEGNLGEGDNKNSIKQNIELLASYKDFHAGENKEAEIKAAFVKNSEYACKYELEVDGLATGTIKPRPVRLLVNGDYEVCYSNFDLNEMQDKVRITVNENDIIYGDDKSVFDSELPKADLMEEVPRYEGQPCMTSPNGLQVIGIDVKEPGKEYKLKDRLFKRRITDSDYEFVFSKDSCRWLKITEEQINILDYIRISKKSKHVCQDQENPEKIWIGNKEDQGILYLEPAKNEEGKFYKAVGYDKKGNLTEDGIISDQVISDFFSIYLVPQEPDNGLHTENEGRSRVTDLCVSKDEKAPDVKIQMGITDTAVTKSLEHITFGVYSKQAMSAMILAEDKQSQTANVKYAFYQIKELPVYFKE